MSAGVRAAWTALAAVQKPGHGVPWYMRVVNRRLGRAFAAVLSTTRVSPDQVTLTSGLVTAAGLVVLVLSPVCVPTACVVVVLLQVGFALDAADGQLARLTGRGSVAGEWADHVVDVARTGCLHLAVAVALVRHGHVATSWALLPLGFCVVATVRFHAQVLAAQLGRAVSGCAATVRGSRRSRRLQLPADAGVINAVLLLWSWPAVFLVGYGGLAAANTVLLGATLVRRRRDLSGDRR